MAQKNNLEVIPVINEYGKMIVGDEKFWQKTTEAREVIVEYLRNEGLLETK